MSTENKVTPPSNNTHDGKSYTIQVFHNLTNVLSSNDQRSTGSNTLQNNNSSVDNDVNSTENKKP